jgi:predicted AAA+ superfamily ATPase
MKRYLEGQIRADLVRKMVFLGGPRQVGKTTLARQILGSRSGYLNWDVAADRRRILAEELPKSSLWVFDELHKYRSWRNYLKGLFDGRPPGQQMLVTGSARLDFYRFGGDSLQGRYHYLRLHPLSVAELGIRSHKDWLALLTLGGFPEPFLSGSQTEARRWSRDYYSRLIRDQIVGLERLQDLGNLELLAMRLPDLVGSPLSINALREELRLSHGTVAKWIEILERMYAIFRLVPFGAPRIRAVRKEQKHYHFDWSVVPNDAARFENVVASHLLKWVHFRQDAEGLDLELRYFRDVDGREVDFVVTERRRPIRLIECKWDDAEIGRGLRYLRQRFPEVEAYQVSAIGRRDAVTGDGIRVCPAIELLRTLV